MRCECCSENAVISSDNGTFCATHFKKNFEGIVLSTIKKYDLIHDGERIAIANSGGKDSLSLLYVLQKYLMDKNELISITVDEGIEGYRNKTIKTMEEYCRRWGVAYKVYSYKEFAGATMDNITKKEHGIPCATCGVLRRHVLNRAASENRADKLATAHNLDDEAENVVMNLFQNDFEKMVRLGPVSGTSARPGFVPRIKPFMFLSEKETMLFSILNGIDALHSPCPYAGFGFRGVVSRRIKEAESIVPGSKKRLVENMLVIKERYGTGKEEPARKLIKCRMCGEPASDELCAACGIKMRLERF